jgi:hypothetical protein
MRLWSAPPGGGTSGTPLPARRYAVHAVCDSNFERLGSRDSRTALGSNLGRDSHRALGVAVRGVRLRGALVLGALLVLHLEHVSLLFFSC